MKVSGGDGQRGSKKSSLLPSDAMRRVSAEEFSLLGDGPVALACLVLVLDDVLLLQLAHALDFVEIDDEALVIAVERLDALATEDVQVVGAVEVLYALRMLLTELISETLLVFILEVEAGARQDWVLLDDLVQDVDVEG